MIRKLFPIIFLWGFSVFFYFFIGNLWQIINIDFFWVIPFIILVETRQPVLLLAIIIFGLTADSWVLFYPGITTFSNFILGLFYLKLQNKLLSNDIVSRTFILIIGLLFVKLISFTLILLLSSESLFILFLKWNFWLNFWLTIGFGLFFYSIIIRLNNRYKLFIWSKN